MITFYCLLLLLTTVISLTHSSSIITRELFHFIPILGGARVVPPVIRATGSGDLGPVARSSSGELPVAVYIYTPLTTVSHGIMTTECS